MNKRGGGEKSRVVRGPEGKGSKQQKKDQKRLRRRENLTSAPRKGTGGKETKHTVIYTRKNAVLTKQMRTCQGRGGGDGRKRSDRPHEKKETLAGQEKRRFCDESRKISETNKVSRQKKPSWLEGERGWPQCAPKGGRGNKEGFRISVRGEGKNAAWPVGKPFWERRVSTGGAFGRSQRRKEEGRASRIFTEGGALAKEVIKEGGHV